MDLLGTRHLGGMIPSMNRLDRTLLEKLYWKDGYSIGSIAEQFAVSKSTVHYWFSKYEIPKRCISDAVYLRHNPDDVSCAYKQPETNAEWLIAGLGFGIYWREQKKKKTNSIQVSNSDPRLIAIFLVFLENIYGIKLNQLKFDLRICSEMLEADAKKYWMKMLSIEESQFRKVIIKSSYDRKGRQEEHANGILSICVNSGKLKNHLLDFIESFGSI